MRIAVRFSHGFEGEQLHLFHRHILEHEHEGVVVNYRPVDP